MVERRRSRAIAVEILYQKEMTDFSLDTIFERRIESSGEKVSGFSKKLLKGIEANQEMIDGLIDDYAKNWAIERLPVVDRNILRISIYEMVYEPEIPASVSINEAIELAKIYGSVESGKFVNGVLGQVARNLEENEKEPSKKESR